MRAQQTIYAWDYHHGQATRVVMGGLCPLRGTTMLEKQGDFIKRYDYVRTSLMQEPRGHKNMLGAVLTEPVTSDGHIGILFLSPQGYFDMCGDSTFSAVAAMIDSGMISHAHPDDEIQINLDTVAGRVNVRVQLKDGEATAITFNNVASFSLGTQTLPVPGTGPVEAWLGYGGLLYAFVKAQDVGIHSLQDAKRDNLLETGTRVWHAARENIRIVLSGAFKPIDLITLWEPLDKERGARVANFYAPLTTGRTPSGTGLSARVAIEAAAGRLVKGETYFHESLLGLRFAGRIASEGIGSAYANVSGIIPSITARSFLMGTGQWILHPDDPFRSGFTF